MIEEFYQSNSVDNDFEEIFYEKTYPEVKNFYQPYCAENNISERERLFFHYANYGKNNNYKKNLIEFIKHRVIGLELEFLNKTIEDFWPVHENYLESYEQNVKNGQIISKKSKIAVVALARNCEKQLQNSIDRIKELESLRFKLFVYENNSVDKTKEILKRNHQIEISLNNDDSLYLKDRSRTRTNNLAIYRNFCLDWIRKNCFDFDYVVVLDLDSDLGFSINGIYNSISWLNKINNAGGMGSYSLYLNVQAHSVSFAHYDSFAVRLNNWLPTQENFDENNIWFRNLHPPVGSDPVLFYSCFGGLAVYKTKAFVLGNYDGSIGSEHVLFHKSLKDNGYNMYLNPSSRFFAIYNKP